jgi:hypothetical protein
MFFFAFFFSCTQQDSRIEGGYENVPTIDIHLNQVGLHEQWLFFLKYYVYPLVEKVFQGYTGDVRILLSNLVFHSSFFNI